MSRHEQESEPEKLRENAELGNQGSGATFFSLSIMVGAGCLTLADYFPGGLSGAEGFLIGFAASFIFSIAMVAVQVRRALRIEEHVSITESRTAERRALPRSTLTPVEGRQL